MLEDLSCALGLRGADLEHNLVVRPGDRSAIDSSVEQPVVDGSERQHREVGARALNRQVATAGVALVTGGQPGEGEDAAEPLGGVFADQDAAHRGTARVVLAPPTREDRVSLGEGVEPLLGFGHV